MEATPSTDPTTQETSDDVMLIEELIYPYELTLDLIKQYRRFTTLNMDKNLSMMYRKLYRSARYWRLEAAEYKWLATRMR